MIDWQPVATIPHDGRMVMVYRPLAAKSNDEPIAIKRTEAENRWCWPCTVPEGETPTNPTNGSCHVTHWAELIAPSNYCSAAKNDIATPPNPAPKPPAASVTNAMVGRAQDCLHDKGKDIGYYHMRAALEAALAAQENPNG